MRHLSHLHRQSELLALQHLSIVDPEEIRIEDGLDQAGQDGDAVGEILGEVAPDPIGDIQGAITTQGEQVMRGDGLGLAGALQEEELRQDGDALEPDGEGPEDLGGRVAVGIDEGEDQRAPEEVLDAEGIEVRIVGGLVGGGHEIEGVPRGAEEEELEDGVVGRVGEGPE